MTERLNSIFSHTKSQNRAALITFMMGYDPDEAASSALLAALPEAGADIIEIGMPFSDPMADGPVIEAAGLRALAAGASLAGILRMVAQFREKNAYTPIILMGYFNPVYRYGCETFCRDATKAGVDGLIIVDLPPEEESELTAPMRAHGLHFIRLIAPGSDEARLGKLCASAGGFVYYISVAGITGAKSATHASLSDNIARIRRHTQLPVAAGFGIKTPEQAKQAAQLADAVVVGSALVEKFHSSGQAAALAFVRELAQAVAKKP